MESIDTDNFEKMIMSSSLVSVFFYEDNIPQCSQILDFLQELLAQDEFKGIKFFKVNVKNNLQLSKQFSISSVPTVVFFRLSNEMERVVGADTSAVINKLRKLLEFDSIIEKKLVSLINREPIMVFIKGTPENPRCRFTNALIKLLNEKNIKYGSFDILGDEEVRQSLKAFSKWPTYPQLYVKGKLIGGLDIIQDLNESGELDDVLKI